MLATLVMMYIDRTVTLPQVSDGLSFQNVFEGAGGTFEVRSAPDEGTTASGRIPTTTVSDVPPV